MDFRRDANLCDLDVVSKLLGVQYATMTVAYGYFNSCKVMVYFICLVVGGNTVWCKQATWPCLGIIA